MFNIGFAELILVLLVAFLIVGPKDLPKVQMRFMHSMGGNWHILNKRRTALFPGV